MNRLEDKKIFILLLIIISFSCRSTSNGSGSGCAGVTSSGATGDSNIPASETSSLFDEPIDIPIPIAKAVDGVDPTSMSFSSSGLNSTSLRPLEEESFEDNIDLACSGVSTTITGKSIDQNVTVDAYLDGSIVCTTEDTGTNRDFTCEICQNVCGSQVLFIVRGSNGTGSYPVSFLCEESDDVIPSVNAKQVITNITGIQRIKPAAGDSLAAYCARTLNGEYLIAQSELTASVPERISAADELDACLSDLVFDNSEEALFAKDSTDQFFDIDLTSGLLTELAVSNSDLRIFDDDNYYASVVTQGNDEVVQIIDASNFETSLILSDSDTETVERLELATSDDDILVVSKELSNDTQKFELYNLSSSLGSDATITPVALYTTPYLIRNIQVNPAPADGVDFIYEGIDAEERRSLIYSDGSSDEVLVDSDDNLSDIRNCTWTSDGNYILCDAIPDEDTSVRLIFAYDFQNDELVRLFKDAEMPARAAAYDSVFIYLAADSNGVRQIGIHNLANDNRFE